jgi:hypothetical protein
MKDLLFNFNSIEVSYGDDALNTVIKIDERINDLKSSLQRHDSINDFEKSEWNDRLNKLIALNENIQGELRKQVEKLKMIPAALEKKAELL